MTSQERDNRFPFLAMHLYKPNKMSEYSSSEFEQQEFKDALAQYEEMIKGNATSYFDADQFADFAEYYLSKGRYKDAMQVIDYALKIHPDSSEILVIQAHILIDQNKINEAKAIVRCIGEDSIEVQLLEAELFLVEKKPKEAERIFIDMIETRDDIDKEDYKSIIYLYEDFDMPAKAIEWFEKAILLFPQEDYMLMDMALCYVETGNTEKAINMLNDLIDANPYESEYWYGLGKVYYMTDNYNKAIEAYEFVLTIEPEHSKAILMMAHCYFKLENYEESAQFYLKYSTFEPESEMPLFFCALCYFTSEKFDQALLYFKEALQKVQEGSPQLIDIYSYIALTYSKMNNIDEALNYIDLAIRQDESCADSYIYKGRFYLYAENAEKAIECFDKAIAIDPNDMKVYNDLGITYFECKDYPMAIEAFRKIAETDPGYGLSNIYLAYLYLQVGYRRNFQKFFIEAVKEAPEKILDFLGYLPDEEAGVKQLIINLKAAIEQDLKDGQID